MKLGLLKVAVSRRAYLIKEIGINCVMDRCRYLCCMNEIFEKEDKTATPSCINILRYLNSIFGH